MWARMIIIPEVYYTTAKYEGTYEYQLVTMNGVDVNDLLMRIDKTLLSQLVEALICCGKSVDISATRRVLRTSRSKCECQEHSSRHLSLLYTYLHKLQYRISKFLPDPIQRCENGCAIILFNNKNPPSTKFPCLKLHKLRLPLRPFSISQAPP